MTGDVLHAFAGLTVAVAGIAFGLCWTIIPIYWRVYRTVTNGARLLPLHIIGIGTSYSMFALVGVARLGDPPPPVPGQGWWVYPFVTLAFLIGDASLILILRFIAKRGQRYRPAKERRA